MVNKKLARYMVTGALSLGIISGAVVPAFAATANENETSSLEKFKVRWSQNVDEATQEKIQMIMEDAHAELAALGIEMPQKRMKVARFGNLDEATKEKVDAVMDDVKAGTITHDEAKAKLQELGINIQLRGPKGKSPMGNPFANLDEATKEKAEAIMEEAHAEIAELGVDFRGKGHGPMRGMID